VTEIIPLSLVDRLQISKIRLAATMAFAPFALSSADRTVEIILQSDPLAVVAPGSAAALALAQIFKGDRGDPGPPGPDSAANLVAGATVSGHRVIMLDSLGNGIHADPTASNYRFAGISISAANIGGAFQARITGEIVEPTWNWTPGDFLFVGANGVLKPTPPTSGVSQIVSVAKTPTSIIVQPQMPIIMLA
jgi:hypothetical protein